MGKFKLKGKGEKHKIKAAKQQISLEPSNLMKGEDGKYNWYWMIFTSFSLEPAYPPRFSQLTFYFIVFFFILVPYDSTKPFVWSEYLVACGAKAVPNIVFKQVCCQ